MKYWGPPPAMRSFGKSTGDQSGFKPNTMSSNFAPSTRISTNYPQFPSNWGDHRRPFSPERDRDTATPESVRTTTSNPPKTGSLADALNELTMKRTQIPRNTNMNGGPNGLAGATSSIPGRSRSFLRNSRPEQFGGPLAFKRSGSEEPTSVTSPQPNTMPFPNQFPYPNDTIDSSWLGSSTIGEADGNFKELSIITNNDMVGGFGPSIDNQSLASMEVGFRFKSTNSIKSDADYTNNTLPHKNSTLRSVNLNYHNVGGNFMDNKMAPSHFIPIYPEQNENVYSVPSTPDSPPSNLAAVCEQTSKLWYRAKMTRDDITAALCRQPVGSFIIRDSTSYPGYYGLAIKTDMSGVNGTAISGSADSIRHFLIETSVRGARIKGSPAEPHYKSLADLVEQHVRTAISLPCKLVLPPVISQSQQKQTGSSQTNLHNSKFNQSHEAFNFNTDTVRRGNSMSSTTHNSIHQQNKGFPLAAKSPNHVAVTIPSVQFSQLDFNDEGKEGSIISSVSRRLKSPNRTEDSLTSHQLNANLKTDRAVSNTSLNSQHTTSSVNTIATNNASNGPEKQISAACMVLYLGCYDVELLSGASAVNRAVFCLLEDERQLKLRMAADPTTSSPTSGGPRPFSPNNGSLIHLNSGSQRPIHITSEPSPVHFRMDQKAVTVTDMSRKVFFRKCISLQALLYCGIPASSNWASILIKHEGKDHIKKLFGLVTRKDGQMSAKTNQCWLFAEYEDDQPASAIINFARKLTTSFVPFPSNFLGTD